MVETRIKIKGGMYCVQRMVKVFCFFRKWKDVASFESYHDALLFRATWLPKEIFDKQHIKMAL